MKRQRKSTVKYSPSSSNRILGDHHTPLVGSWELELESVVEIDGVARCELEEDRTLGVRRVDGEPYRRETDGGDGCLREEIKRKNQRENESKERCFRFTNLELFPTVRATLIRSDELTRHPQRRSEEFLDSWDGGVVLPVLDSSESGDEIVHLDRTDVLDRPTERGFRSSDRAEAGDSLSLEKVEPEEQPEGVLGEESIRPKEESSKMDEKSWSRGVG